MDEFNYFYASHVKESIAPTITVTPYTVLGRQLSKVVRVEALIDCETVQGQTSYSRIETKNDNTST